MSEQLIELRHSIHQYPELSGREKKTPDRIEEFLKTQGIHRVERLDPGGMLVHFDFGEGPFVMFRCELDALPIEEENDEIDYSSKIEGKAHSCGHDGHMAIVTGLALALRDNPLPRGRVTLLYQPAEETGQGARQLLETERIRKLKPDYIFALHNVPGFEMGKVLYSIGSFSPAVTSMIIELHGRTSHAAEPELGINPAGVLGDILNHTRSLENNNPDSDDFFLITPILIRLGEEAHGTSAGHARLHFTLRSYDRDMLEGVCNDLENWISDMAREEGLQHEVSYTESFSPTINSEEAIKKLITGAKAAGLTTRELERPFRWGEDFGAYTEIWNGAMIGLGSGTDTPPLHAPNYDFPDELIEKAVDLFLHTAKSAVEK